MPRPVFDCHHPPQTCITPPLILSSPSNILSASSNSNSWSKIIPGLSIYTLRCLVSEQRVAKTWASTSPHPDTPSLFNLFKPSPSISTSFVNVLLYPICASSKWSSLNLIFSPFLLPSWSISLHQLHHSTFDSIFITSTFPLHLPLLTHVTPV